MIPLCFIKVGRVIPNAPRKADRRERRFRDNAPDLEHA
jgi:hypothetical protein